MQSVSQHSQVTQFSKSPQLQLLQLHSLLQHSQLLYRLSNVIPKPLISFNVRQTKYLRVNSQVFGKAGIDLKNGEITDLTIRWF